LFRRSIGQGAATRSPPAGSGCGARCLEALDDAELDWLSC
jgi:hypothetical protein